MTLPLQAIQSTIPAPADFKRVLLKKQCLRDFKIFVRHAWGIVDPDTLIWGPHIEHICDHLQAVTEGKIKYLVINIPPGHAKSMLVSVLWPAWNWVRNPAWRVLTSSYGMDLAIRDASKSRTLIESQWFKDHFARDWKVNSPEEDDAYFWTMEKAQNQKTFYQNTQKGFRLCLSVGGKGTGFRGDCIISDDPQNAMEAASKVSRDSVIKWWTETMSSRLNDPLTGAKVIVMQRLHEEDLTGYLLAKSTAGTITHLCLPSEFDPTRRYKTLIGTDWRTEEGEALFPARYPKEVLAEIKKPATGMGSMAYAGQHQQRPAPAEGGMIQRSWFARRWWKPGQIVPEGVQGVRLPERFDEIQIFTDCAFKKLEDNDRVAIGVVGRKGPDKYLIDLVWDRLSFTETVQALSDLINKWDAIQKIKAIRVEDKANGSAVIEVLKTKFSRVVPMEPEGGKEARVSAITGELEALNYILPLDHPKISDAIEEAVAFPKAAHDDFIDMSAYALYYMGTKSALAKFRSMATL